MNEVKSLPYYRAGLESTCIFLSILSAVVLLIVWALADTIAARNISIAVGLVASTGWVLLARPRITRSDFIVPALLMGVPIWLWVIYFFFPIDAAAQYKEMTGTWLRVMLLIIFGFNLGLMISKNNKLAIWIWLALASLPVAGLAMYLHEIYIGKPWNIYLYVSFFKTKVAGVYFLMWPCLLSYAGLHKALIDQAILPISFKVLVKIGVNVLLLAVCLWMFYIIHALTGILVSGLFFIVLLFLCFVYLVLSSKIKFRNKLMATSLIFIVAISVLGLCWQYDQEHQKKLTHVASDILSSMDIQKSSIWKRMPNSDENLPISSNGSQVNMSTYERVSWFQKGVEYLIAHPFGTGDMHLSFGKYMRDEYPGSLADKTHSGWLDFSLGAGVPSLILIWSAIFLSLIRTIQLQKENSKSFISVATIWLLSGVWLLWWPGELSYREFLEHYVFMIVLLGAATRALRRF